MSHWHTPASLLLLVAIAAGCGDEPIVPQIVYPERYERLAPDHVYQVPPWQAGDPLVEFVVAEPARAGWRLAFEGTVTAERGEDRIGACLPHAILLLIVRRDENGKVLFLNSGGTDLSVSRQYRNPDGSLVNTSDYEQEGTRPYHVSLQGPTAPGLYTVTVFANGGAYSAEPIARAELTVAAASDQ